MDLPRTGAPLIQAPMDILGFRQELASGDQLHGAANGRGAPPGTDDIGAVDQDAAR